MKIVRFELSDVEEKMFRDATSMQEFYSVTPKIFFMMCVARAVDSEKRENRLTPRKGIATPMQDAAKSLPEARPIPVQPVYKQPVYKSYTPEEAIQFGAEMAALIN